MNNTKNKPRRVWLLLEGAYYTDGGMVVVASETKKAIRAWVKDNYPGHHAKHTGSDRCELYYENDAEQSWLRMERIDHCPLLLK